MPEADYYKFLALRGRLSRENIPEVLAESQFIAELQRKGYDFMDYFGAHHIFTAQQGEQQDRSNQDDGQDH